MLLSIDSEALLETCVQPQAQSALLNSFSAVSVVYPDVERAVLAFNLRLMKKGPCAFSRYHCMGLAGRLLTY